MFKSNTGRFKQTVVYHISKMLIVTFFLIDKEKKRKFYITRGFKYNNCHYIALIYLFLVLDRIKAASMNIVQQVLQPIDVGDGCPQGCNLNKQKILKIIF